MSNHPSILMCVGEDNYTLADFIDEAFDIGVSKRIPLTSIPNGLVKGISKIFLAHPKAIVKTTRGGTLEDLAWDLVEDGAMTQMEWARFVEADKPPFWSGAELHSNDLVPGHMLLVTYAFSRAKQETQGRLIEKYGLKFCMGVFGYAPFTGLQYVLPDDEYELPEELQHLDGYIEPVHVVYEYDEGDSDGTDQ